jgi:hypothetical protein
MAVTLRWCLIAMAVVAGIAACGSSSKAANVPVSTSCAAAMTASAKADDNPNLTNAQDLATQSATVHDCQSRAEWLQAAIPYTSSGLSTCVVCGNAKPSEVLAGLCTGDDASAPACK